MRKLYFLFLLCIATATVYGQVTVDVYPASTPFATGSVNATGTKNDGNMVTINSTTNRGWALFDLSGIPAGSIVNSATLTFTTYTSTLSTAINNIYGFRGDPAALSGTTLYTNTGAGSSLLASSWAADATIGPSSLNAAGLAFLSNNIGFPDVVLGFVRGSTNTYNIYGYPGTAAQQPKLTITYTAVSCASPNSLSVSNLAATSATINWNASPSSPTGGYQYEVRTSGAAGSGATGLAASGSTGAGVLTANVTGLSGSTNYSVYVRSDCGGSGFSAWTSAFTFTTPCAPLTTLPFFENFNNAGLPACWSTALVSGTVNWTAGTTTSPGGFGDIPAPFSGTRFTAKAYTTSTADLISPPMNLSSLGTNQARFSIYIYRISATVAADEISVYINTAPNTSGATNLLTIKTLTTEAPAVPASGWYKYGADIPVSFNSGGPVYFIIEGVSAPGSAGYDLGVEDFLVEQIPSCEVPTGISISNITTTGADVTWTDPSVGNPPVNYQLYYSTTNTAPTSGTSPTVSGVSGTTTTLSGLTAASTYYLWIRTNCGPGNISVWTSVPVTFTTACLSTSVPTAVQSFDAATMPICWSRSLVTGTINWAPDTDNDGVPSAHTGTRFMGKDYTASDALVISQPINMTTAGPNGARINVWIYRNTVNKANDRIRFHVNTTPDLSGSTQLLEIFPLTTVAPTVGAVGWYNYTADIPASYNTESTVYIIGQGTTDGTFASYGIGFDDFKVEVIPSCNEPTGVTVSNVTTTGAQVDWTDPSSGPPASYQLYYSMSNTAPTGATTPTVTGVTGTTTNISGLTPASTYYLWVRSFCGGSDVSVWTITPVTFTTACTSASIPTAVQSFDAATMPVCWSTSLVTGTTNWAPDTDNDGVPAAHTGARFMGKNYTASDALVVSQPINMTTAGVNGARINVWIYRNTVNKANDRIRFHVNITPDLSGATQLLEIFPLTTVAPTVGSVGWYNYTADIPASYNTESTVYIIAQGTTDGSFASYGIGFDDFKVEVIPTCNEPTGVAVSNITTTGAQVDWTDPSSGPPASYQLYYSTSNTAPTGATTPTVTGVTGNTTNISGLTPSSTYYLWIRSFCGGSDVSAWTATAVTFNTACVSASIPTAVQSFDAATIPICWSRSLVTGTINWAPDTDNDGVPAAHTGARFMGKDYTASDALVISQPINMTTAGPSGARISVWIYRNTVNKANDRIRFHVNITPDMSGATQLLEIFPRTSVAPTVASVGWYKYTADIPASYNTEPTVYIIGQGTTDGTAASYGIGFDDFRVEVIPTCDEPVSLLKSGITMTNAQVDWTPPASGSVTDYSWELRTSGAAGSGASGLVTSGSTATTTANFTTLTGGTTYTFYVRTNCVSPDVSTYASTTFTTLPANDDCTGAIGLFTNTPYNSTTVGASQSTAAEPCAGFTGTADDDVWFKFTAHYNGNATITVPQNIIDAVVHAYSGTCGALTNIGCSDEFTPTDEVINLTGLVAGNVYYIRVYSYGNALADRGNFTITITGSALPVSLVSFKGETAGSLNKLLWQTATETNNKGFELQRSADGKNFSSLAFVTTKAENGNSTSILNYNYNDVRPLSGTNYYRLKQIDRDGKFAYSNIVVLKSKVTSITLSSVYPNPATKELNLVITSPSVEKVTIIITDLTGKVLMQRPAQLVIGDNQSQLNIQSLAAGTYLIKAVCANGCETVVHRFVKQ